MKSRYLLSLAFLPLLVLFVVIPSTAQEQPGVSDSLYSHHLQEMRTLEIRVPATYDPDSGEKFTVIYMVDGEWNTGNMGFIHGFARQEGLVPDALLVGIRNTYIDGANQRDRDFLPTNNVEAFLDFIELELMPYIDSKYPAGTDRILFGHSFGGVFSMYTLLTRPHLFDSYISSDPPFGWNDRHLVNLAEEIFTNVSDLDKSLWVIGITETYSDMGINLMDSVLQVNAPHNLHWESMAYPNETHNSVRLKGIYDGLKFIFDGYRADFQFHPQNGVIVPGQPITVWIFSGNPGSIRYTTDGSPPDESSAGLDNQVRTISLSEPTTLTVTSLNRRGKYGRVLSGTFDDAELPRPIDKPDNVKQGVWNYSYYEGEWNRLPDFSGLKPVQTGFVDEDFDLHMLPRSENFGCLIEGYIEIVNDGYYIFALDSDDGAKLYIGDSLIINYDGLHGMGDVKSYVLPLDAGFYTIRLEYFQRGGGMGLTLVYVPPGMVEPSPHPIPAVMRYGLE